MLLLVERYCQTLCSIFKSIASCLIASGTIFGAISGLQISQWQNFQGFIHLLLTNWPLWRISLDLDDPIDAFHLPLSSQAFEEFHEFNHLIEQTRDTRNADGNDIWYYSWDNLSPLTNFTSWTLSTFRPRFSRPRFRNQNARPKSNPFSGCLLTTT
jgi:hypothetical protein